MNIYVDINAPREGSGTKENPFKHISSAAKVAVAGDHVLVAPGIYREYVNPVHGGSEDAPIVYTSTVPLGAMITGAERVTDWQLYQGTTWMARIDNSIFAVRQSPLHPFCTDGDTAVSHSCSEPAPGEIPSAADDKMPVVYNPYTVPVYGDWYFAEKPDRHTGAVFLNDRQMYEAESLEDCLAGEIYQPSWEKDFAMYKWFSVQEKDDEPAAPERCNYTDGRHCAGNGTTVIYANFHGLDPRKENVEIVVRRNCFMPEENGVNYITVDGFTICKAATTWAPPASFQDGMIGPNWAKGWIIENCDIYGSKCCGISLGKYCDIENDQYFTRKHVKSPTQMERDAVCRGQFHGWTKENIGHHIIRKCHIHDCGQCGIVGRMGAVFSLIEDNHIHNICSMQQLGGAETSGIKLHAAIDVVIRRNHFHHCIMGVWCDWEAQGTRISQNLMHDNDYPDDAPMIVGAMGSQDIFVEVGHGPTLIDNNVLLSKHSLRMPTEGVAMVHNLVSGSLTSIDAGCDSFVNGKNEPRYTPYHIRHRTEVAGFMTILHGDDRFYNNIFVQRFPVDSSTPTDLEVKSEEMVGTFRFEKYPTYEEWLANFQMNERPNMNHLAQFHFAHLPVWMGGNAYFAGAKACRHDGDALVDTTSEVMLEIQQEGNQYLLKTNLDKLVENVHCPVITSDVLGYAFEPEQRFENPDGSTIVFDTDFFGNHRGTSTIPGPFAAFQSVL